MTDEVSFAYRLPLTYIRVTGTRTEVTDLLSQTKVVECKSVVTTESGADLLTRIPVTLSPKSMSEQKSTWKLMSDGRLAGADMATTVEPMAGWSAALGAGAAVLGAGAPLLAMGPPGWIALAGAAGVAVAGAGLAVTADGEGGEAGLRAVKGTRPKPPAPADPAEWDVHEEFVKEHPEPAQALADYRAALSTGMAQHAAAVRASLLAETDAVKSFWELRVQFLKRMLASASVGSAATEAIYARWLSSKSRSVTFDWDERLRIDDLPDLAGLDEWLADPDATFPRWRALADKLQVAVSVDLEEIPGDNHRLRRVKYRPPASDDLVHYRQPRPAVVQVWKLTTHGGKRGRTLVDVRRVFVAYPGNEARLSIASGDDSNSAVAAAFDESGALTSITSEAIDQRLQRAHDVSALIPALSAAAEAGSGLRKALAPPSLVDRAAEAKAAKELGLTPSAADPLKELKEQLAEDQLRAQLKIAQQLAASTSAPVMVSVNVPLDG